MSCVFSPAFHVGVVNISVNFTTWRLRINWPVLCVYCRNLVTAPPWSSYQYQGQSQGLRPSKIVSLSRLFPVWINCKSEFILKVLILQGLISGISRQALSGLKIVSLRDPDRAQLFHVLSLRPIAPKLSFWIFFFFCIIQNTFVFFGSPTLLFSILKTLNYKKSQLFLLLSFTSNIYGQKN
jgi:hypothetical protein